MHGRRIGGSSTCRRPKQIEGFGPRSSPALNLSVPLSRILSPFSKSENSRSYGIVKSLEVIGNLCEFARHAQTHFTNRMQHIQKTLISEYRKHRRKIRAFRSIFRYKFDKTDARTQRIAMRVLSKREIVKRKNFRNFCTK